MEIRIEHINDWEKRIYITAPWDAVGEDYNLLVTRYSKIPLKGFRAGKVPAGVVEQAFRNELRDDLAAECGKRLCRTALAENNMDLASPIELSEVNLQKGATLSFCASFMAMPPFELPPYADLQIGSQTAEERIDEISERLLRYTDIEPHPTLVEHELLYGPEEDKEEAACQRVKLYLILKKIAAAEGIKVDQKDADAKLVELAEQTGMSEKELKNYLVQNSGMERFMDTLLAEQILNFIDGLQNNV